MTSGLLWLGAGLLVGFVAGAQTALVFARSVIEEMERRGMVVREKDRS